MAILNCEDRKKYPEFAKINFANYMLISKILFLLMQDLGKTQQFV